MMNPNNCHPYYQALRSLREQREAGTIRKKEITNERRKRELEKTATELKTVLNYSTLRSNRTKNLFRCSLVVEHKRLCVFMCVRVC